MSNLAEELQHVSLTVTDVQSHNPTAFCQSVAQEHPIQHQQQTVHCFRNDM